MDNQRERHQSDLRGLIAGDVRFEDLSLQLYSGDASVFEVKPLGVLRPRSLSEIVACLNYAAEVGISVQPRGSATSTVGGSLGGGLILDFASLRRIHEITDSTVTVQPGISFQDLERQLSARGKTLGVQPANSPQSTVGGMAAVNASSRRWLKYGSFREAVLEMEVVLASGEVVRTSRATPAYGNESPLPQPLGTRVANLLADHNKELEVQRTRSHVSSCGYQLADALENETLNFPAMMCGSEGTLGVISELTLRIYPKPKRRIITLLFFDRLDKAVQGALGVSNTPAVACDLLDRRLITLIQERQGPLARKIPVTAEAMLAVEFAGDQLPDIRSYADTLVATFRRHDRLAFDATVIVDPQEVSQCEGILSRVESLLDGIRGSESPLPGLEDLAVPVDKLPQLLPQIREVLQQYQMTASIHGHVGHGQLSVHPLVNFADVAARRQYIPLLKDIAQKVIAVGGVTCAARGQGIAWSWFAPQQFGEVHKIHAEVKQLFDPAGVLNPGKVAHKHLIEPSTYFARRLSSQPADSNPLGEAQQTNTPVGTPDDELGQRGDLSAWVLNWPSGGLSQEVARCSGCGVCQTTEPSSRMCPMYRAASREESTPRARAGQLRAILNGGLPPESLAEEGFREVANLCIHCHQCRRECPSQVDIPKLMVEAKAQHVAQSGLPLGESIVSRLDLIGSLGSKFRPLANWAIGSRFVRWALEKTFGLAQGRKLPRFAKGSYLRQATKARLTRIPKQSRQGAAVFIDLYANWFDHQLAEATVAVLRHNNVPVFVPPDQQSAGMSMISLGLTTAAKSVAAKNVKLLADIIRQGFTVVTPEPSAALCITHEYPNLLDDEDTALVAANTMDVSSYLWNLHRSGKLALDFQPMNLAIGYHLPCHLRTLVHDQPDLANDLAPGLALLQLIPGLEVSYLDKGCSGMAGTFGLQKKNYRTSLRIGWNLISAIRSGDLQVGATECAACKMQMEQGTTKPTLHPIKLLAMAYGLLPLQASLAPTREELVVS